MGLLLIIGTYNEAATIDSVVERALFACRGAGINVELLVVDDASPDGTAELVAKLATEEPAVHLLERPEKLGLGSALRAGIRWGLERDYTAFGFMDGDLSHDPHDLPRLVASLDEGDLVIGSRYVAGGGVVGWPAFRRRLSEFGNAYVRAATGVSARDTTAGFRVFRRHLIESIDIDTMRAEGYSFEIDLTLRSWRGGYRIIEVPITFRERTEGVSKMSTSIVAEAVWRVLVWGLQGPRRPAPAKTPAADPPPGEP
ncbi:MAG: polyprenol monophosphomannose synthase [Actinobacteria bacterium]|nr:polyprenol monophosphomannose synthase [Actinomycetota bacterium]